MKEGDIELVSFGRDHLEAAIGRFAEAGWETYSEDPERTFRALTVPGGTSLAALDAGEVAGLVQIQSDGEIQAHLSLLLVGERWQGLGVGRRLLTEAFRRAGGMRLDLVTRAGGFYLALGAEPAPGFRLRPDDLGSPGRT